MHLVPNTTGHCAGPWETRPEPQGSLSKHAMSSETYPSLIHTWRRELKNEMWMAGFSYSWRRWRRQHRTELDGDELSVAYAPPGVTRHKSSQDKLMMLTDASSI